MYSFPYLFMMIDDVHKVSNIERHFLVWTKKFKSVDQVPAFVSYVIICLTIFCITLSDYQLFSSDYIIHVNIIICFLIFRRDMMEKTRNILRIKLNLSMIALVAIGSCIAVASGKLAQKRGKLDLNNVIQS